MGCIWSSLNAPGTRRALSHPILKLEDTISYLASCLLFRAQIPTAFRAATLRQWFCRTLHPNGSSERIGPSVMIGDARI